MMRGPRTFSGGCPRRATILLAVLVVVTMAALAGSSAMYLATAEMEGASGVQRRVQVRAMAWSGVQAVMTELSQQRENILNAERPNVTEEWELFTDSSGRRAIVRLVAQQGREVLVSEQGKIDINTATAEMLSQIGFDDGVAAAIVQARGEQPFGSAVELLRVDGVLPEMLFGEGWEHSEAAGYAGDDLPLGETAVHGSALIDRITVFSFDPNVQSGLGPGGSAHRGRLRININTPWNERLGRAIDERFGRGTGELARGIMETGIRINSLGVLIRGAAERNLDQQAWPFVLDAFTVEDGQYVRGRIDLNRAPAAVLACVPGISPEAARQIVEERERVSGDRRRTILWPLLEEILTTDEMAEAADHLTTRSTQWRVVVEAGFLPAGDRRAWADLDDEALQERVAYEAVIDIASERPRVAYLREVSLLAVARSLAGAIQEEEEEDLWMVGLVSMQGEDLGEPDPLPPMPEQSPSTGSFLDRVAESMPADWAASDMFADGISELMGEGPIEPNTVENGSAAGDQRIGRWTPGSRKETGP